MYRLVFLSGRYQGKRLVVRQAITLVGRDSDCHLVLPDDDQIAPHHARFEERRDGIFLVRLSPDHELQRNNEPLLGIVRLAHNDQLLIGQTRLQFQDIIAPHQRYRPSPGLLQPLTGLLAFAILLFEILLLAFLVDWPRLLILPEVEAQDLAQAQELRATREALKSAETNGTSRTASSASVVTLPGTASTADTPLQPDNPPPPELEEADFVPADTNTVLVPLPPRSAADPRIEEAQRLLAQAVSEAQFADYASAFRHLNQLHQSHPDFLPAYIEHARLLEARGDLDAAHERWSQVLGLAPQDSTPYRQAIEQRQRLARLRDLQTQLLPADSRPSATNLPRHVRIVSPDIQKMPSDPDVTEMRVLSATLELAPDERLFQDAVLQIFITFFDIDSTGLIRPTRAIVSPSPILLDDAFAARSSIPVEATYVVPRGLRAQEESDSGQPFSYYGFTLHVFAGQILQDVFAKPRKLLDQPLYFPTAEP